MYYWVNQGKTLKEESNGGYLWAPIKDKQGKTPYHWGTMNKLKQNDLVFNYSKGFIVGYCIIISNPYNAPIPSEFKDVEWEDNGIMADANYIKFKSKISIIDFYNSCSSYLPEKYSPINNSNDVKANQGYLYEISDKVAEVILLLAEEDQLLENIRISKLSDRIFDITTRDSIVNTRILQGEFRRRILHKWKNQCAISGCTITSILIASHIIPWREADNFQRVDIDNGILLAPNYDALFDKHLISFNEIGDIIISNTISKKDLKSLGITGTEKIKNLSEGNIKYLKVHSSRLL
jgi:hypothetical protein